MSSLSIHMICGLFLFLYFPALQIEAFVPGVAHGEGFAGECAVEKDCAEQVSLFHGREQKADIPRRTAQVADYVVAVYVVHPAAGLLAVGVNKELERAHRQI